MFIPGVPYEGQLQLTNLLTKPEREIVEICYHLAIKKSWNLFKDKQCQNYTVSNQAIAFRLWPLKGHAIHVHLHVTRPHFRLLIYIEGFQARSVNCSLISTRFKLTRMFSPSASYIQLKKVSDDAKPCNNTYEYVVTFGTLGLDRGESIQFFYKVKPPTMFMASVRHPIFKALKQELIIITQFNAFLMIRLQALR